MVPSKESTAVWKSQREERYACTISRRNHTSLQRFKNCWKKGSRCTMKPLRWKKHRRSWRTRRDFAKSAFKSRLKINLKKRTYLQRLVYIIFLFLFWTTLLPHSVLNSKKKKTTNFFSNRTKLWNLQTFFEAFWCANCKGKVQADLFKGYSQLRIPLG